MHSNGFRNSPQRVTCGDLIRCAKVAALCVVSLWGIAASGATMSAGSVPSSEREPLRVSLLAPPVLTAAAIDADAPAVYRLPPVTPPAAVEEAWPDDDQRAGHEPQSVVSTVSEAPWQDGNLTADWEAAFGGLGDPVPADPDIDADPPEGGVAAAAPTQVSAAHHDMDPADAADNHPGNVDAGGGAAVEPAVEAGVLPYTPTAVELTAQLLPAVQHACGLAQRGATFAAQAEFVQVLRRIAQSLDAQGDTNEHARALAAGLRALDEADDFAPRGRQLEAEVDVPLIASSHRTPVLAGGTVGITPREAVALYLSYAQRQLGRAVAGQQAGSMALHAMGKLECRLARDDDGNVQGTRRAMTMYMAALEACPQNNLAANELGVLLAHNGHYAEAETMFRRAVSIAATATGYHNLAIAQQKLGRPEQAIANQQQADRLAAWERAGGEVSRRKGIQWVSPEVLARGGQDTWTSTGAVAAATSTPAVDARTTAPTTVGQPPATAPAFAPPPLAVDAQQTTPIRVARPLVTNSPRQMW